MDLDALDPNGPVPPFEQLRSQIAARVADGRLAAGTKLPTVRSLAEELGLAVNTVARAYRELEADGLLETRGRRGTFVGSSAAPPAEVEELAAAYCRSARRHGLTLPQAQRLLEDAWSTASR